MPALGPMQFEMFQSGGGSTAMEAGRQPKVTQKAK